LFTVVAAQMFSGRALTPLSEPLRFFAYPFLAAMLFGRAWVHYQYSAAAEERRASASAGDKFQAGRLISGSRQSADGLIATCDTHPESGCSETRQPAIRTPRA
jgi:hypothetical protein